MAVATTAETKPGQHPREVRASLGISREQMARLFDVSARTIERWEARDDPPPGRAARRLLAQLQEIADLAHIVYTPKGVERFMTTPFPVFDGHTALEVIEAGDASAVFGALAADYEGSIT
ncbi:MAG TPA: helix-turn-helix domain-containing protein [Steroidobacteraceae bacterium]|nr:helix-turn-helix domain-containing protein [Steroidobacteraceae bacterium]